MTPPLPDLIRTSQAELFGTTAGQLSRQARSGRLHRIRYGFYVEAEAWDTATPGERHELFLKVACETTSFAFPLSAESSAFMLGMPLRVVPVEAHLAGHAANGGRSQPGVHRHKPDGRRRDIMAIRGLPCSDPVNSALDVALREDFRWGVAIMDRLLNPRILSGEKGAGRWDPGTLSQKGPVRQARPVQGWALPEEPAPFLSEPAAANASGVLGGTAAKHLVGPAPTPEGWRASRSDRSHVVSVISQIRNTSARRRLSAVLDFADGGAFLPGESLSRVLMHAQGFPQPELQKEFRDRAGLIGYTDFHWRQWSLVGEFDGDAKYEKAEYLNGRTPSQVVIAEKKREDRLRRLGLDVVRWTWADIEQPGRLASLLRDKGLPVTSKPQWRLP